jgi:monothiol glutaredoxin
MALDDVTRGRIQSLIEESEVLLFMKGTREAPQCGFSATVVQLLDQLVPDYATFDVLSDGAVREGVKEYTSWPTIPQLYVRGEFVGGCDILQELYAEGELQRLFGVDAAPLGPLQIEVTDAAAESIRSSLAGAPADQALHLGVDARYQARMFLAPRAPDAVKVESNGVTFALDPLSASRAQGARIDLTRTPRGVAFQVHLPNADSASP